MIYVNAIVMASALTRSMNNYGVAIYQHKSFKRKNRSIYLKFFLTRKDVLSAVLHAMKVISVSHSLGQSRLQC